MDVKFLVKGLELLSFEKTITEIIGRRISGVVDSPAGRDSERGANLDEKLQGKVGIPLLHLVNVAR